MERRLEGRVALVTGGAQGIGAALLFPATLALINTLYAEGPARNRALAGPDILRVVFDPARLRKMLCEFALRDAVDAAGGVEQQGTRAGGALVECEYVGHGGSPVRQDEWSTADQNLTKRTGGSRGVSSCPLVLLVNNAALQGEIAQGGKGGREGFLPSPLYLPVNLNFKNLQRGQEVQEGSPPVLLFSL